MKYLGGIKTVYPFLSDKSSKDEVLSYYFLLCFIVSMTACFFMAGFLRTSGIQIEARFFFFVGIVPNLLLLPFQKSLYAIQDDYNACKIPPFSFVWFFQLIYPFLCVLLFVAISYFSKDTGLENIFEVIVVATYFSYALVVFQRLLLDLLFKWEVFEPKAFWIMFFILFLAFAYQIKDLLMIKMRG